MIPALIPMLDLANHEFSPNNMPDSVHFSVDDDSAVIMALKDYSPGDDITIFYGLRSSGEFLLHNGFVPDGLNPSDRYRLKIGLPKSDPLLRERLRLFQSIGFSNAEKSPLFSFELTPAVPVPDSLVQFSRAFVVKIVEDNGDSLTSKENQLKAWTFLRDRFQLLIRAYGTIEEDSQKNNSNKSIQESSIIRLKLAELRILKAARDLVEGKLQ